jgi:hypothetical protein
MSFRHKVYNIKNRDVFNLPGEKYLKLHQIFIFLPWLSISAI